MPYSSRSRRWSGSSGSASMPPWTFGCSVTTRWPRIAGNPVSSATSVTGTPASAIARAVPPLDSSAQPSSCRPRASSTMPVLSYTESKAVGTPRRVRTTGRVGNHPDGTARGLRCARWPVIGADRRQEARGVDLSKFKPGDWLLVGGGCRHADLRSALDWIEPRGGVRRATTSSTSSSPAGSRGSSSSAPASSPCSLAADAIKPGAVPWPDPARPRRPGSRRCCVIRLLLGEARRRVESTAASGHVASRFLAAVASRSAGARVNFTESGRHRSPTSPTWTSCGTPSKAGRWRTRRRTAAASSPAARPPIPPPPPAVGRGPLRLPTGDWLIVAGGAVMLIFGIVLDWASLGGITREQRVRLLPHRRDRLAAARGRRRVRRSRSRARRWR